MVVELSECDEIGKADEVMVREEVVELVGEVGFGNEVRDEEVSRVSPVFSVEGVKWFDSELRKVEGDSALIIIF